MRLASETEAFVAETGIPFSFIMIMNEDSSADPATGETVKTYAASLGLTGIPVLADGSYQTYATTPWDGTQRPGKCAIAPDMTILDCYAGEDDTLGFDAIVAHAVTNGG